jgi:hypothetical protein
VGILWTFFSLLLFTYSRSFYQHYYIQLAAPLCLLGAGVTLLPRLRLAYYRRDVSAPASTGAPAPARLGITARDLARGAIPVVVLALLAIPLLLLQWSGITTRNCPHCSDPMFEIVGRYVNDAVPPGSAVLATDEQFDLLAARAPSRNDTGYLIDSYGHMIYLGLGLNNRDWGALIGSSLKGEHGNDPYAVMHLPAPQADFLDRASRAAMMVVHDRGLARLTSATVEALKRQADIAEQQSRYTIYRAR